MSIDQRGHHLLRHHVMEMVQVHADPAMVDLVTKVVSAVALAMVDLVTKVVSAVALAKVAIGDMAQVRLVARVMKVTRATKVLEALEVTKALEVLEVTKALEVLEVLEVLEARPILSDLWSMRWNSMPMEMVCSTKASC